MSGAAFDFERYRAHGWIVHRKTLAAGDQFVVNVPRTYTAEEAADIAVWTRGRVTGVTQEDGMPVDERTPGCSILTRGQMREGTHLMTAQEPSEFWCINRVANRRRPMALEILDIEPGQQKVLAHAALACAGSFTVASGATVQAPAALAAGSVITASTRVLGFVFLEV